MNLSFVPFDRRRTPPILVFLSKFVTKVPKVAVDLKGFQGNKTLDDFREFKKFFDFAPREV